MSAIVMCRGDGCRKHDRCYRYRAVPSENQAWGDFDMGVVEGYLCGHHVPIYPSDHLKPENWQESQP